MVVNLPMTWHEVCSGRICSCDSKITLIHWELHFRSLEVVWKLLTMRKEEEEEEEENLKNVGEGRRQEKGLWKKQTQKETYNLNFTNKSLKSKILFNLNE